MRLTKFIASLVVAITASATCGVQAKQTLRAAHAYQPGTSVYVFWDEFAKGINKRSNGELEVQVFHSGQLGGDEQVFRGMKLGTIHMGSGAAANEGVLTDAYYWMDLPYVFKSRESASRVFADKEVDAYLRSKLRADAGTVLLGHIEVGGFRLLINKSRPLKTPADTQGLKFRALSNPSDIALLNAWGFTPTPLPWSDTYPSLEQGMIDGLNLQAAAIKAFGFQELVKYGTQTQALMTYHVAQMNAKVYDRLSPDMKKLIQQEAARALAVANDLDRKDEATVYDELKKKIDIYTPDADEARQWEIPARALWPQLTQKLDKTLVERVVAVQSDSAAAK
ncbi:hypothetical protein GG851_10785 [Bordetella petrii]|nr:hypothetical protein [Bordetella petrii]